MYRACTSCHTKMIVFARKTTIWDTFSLLCVNFNYVEQTRSAEPRDKQRMFLEMTRAKLIVRVFVTEPTARESYLMLTPSLMRLNFENLPSTTAQIDRDGIFEMGQVAEY